VPEIVSRRYLPNPRYCCEACVFGRGKHTCQAATTEQCSIPREGPAEADVDTASPPPSREPGSQSGTAGLRPIGTEFELVEPPDQASNDTRWVRARYRVVAHDNGGKLERLECIEYERITPP